MLAIIVFRLVGGSSQRWGGANSGGGVRVTSGTTNRGTLRNFPPFNKKKKEKVLVSFLRCVELGGMIYCNLRDGGGIYSDSGDFPCKAAVLTGKPGGGKQVWGPLAKAENPPRTTRPAGQASRCGHRRSLECMRAAAVRHSKTKSSNISFLFLNRTSNTLVFPSKY